MEKINPSKDVEETLERVHRSAEQKIIYLPHAILQMSRPDRMISTDEIEAVIWHGEIIEDYPEDARGHSCLMLGGENRSIHIVCAPKQEYLAIITAYIPDETAWSEDLKRRKS